MFCTTIIGDKMFSTLTKSARPTWHTHDKHRVKKKVKWDERGQQVEEEVK
jgi:hypothetical protein